MIKNLKILFLLLVANFLLFNSWGAYTPLPNTTNLISGNGTGGASDSGINPTSVNTNNASTISGGTLPDARLSANVAFLNNSEEVFSGGVKATYFKSPYIEDISGDTVLDTANLILFRNSTQPVIDFNNGFLRDTTGNTNLNWFNKTFPNGWNGSTLTSLNASNFVGRVPTNNLPTDGSYLTNLPVASLTTSSLDGQMLITKNGGVAPTNAVSNVTFSGATNLNPVFTGLVQLSATNTTAVAMYGPDASGNLTANSIPSGGGSGNASTNISQAWSSGTINLFNGVVDIKADTSVGDVYMTNGVGANNIMTVGNYWLLTSLNGGLTISSSSGVTTTGNLLANYGDVDSGYGIKVGNRPDNNDSAGNPLPNTLPGALLFDDKQNSWYVTGSTTNMITGGLSATNSVAIGSTGYTNNMTVKFGTAGPTNNPVSVDVYFKAASAVLYDQAGHILHTYTSVVTSDTYGYLRPGWSLVGTTMTGNAVQHAQ